jgi:hypothetical protein
MNFPSRVPCRELFKKLKILPLQSQYILSLLLFVIKNRDIFKSSSVIRSINTRYSTDLHPPISNLTKFQKGTFYFGIKVFNHLSFSIKYLSLKEKQFRPALKRFLLTIHFIHWMNILIGIRLKILVLRNFIS